MSNTRVQPALSPAEVEVIDQLAALTHAKRTDVVKSALTVYHWFVRQALIGSEVLARKPTGEEVALETAELSALAGRGSRLGPDELERLGELLASTTDTVEAARLRERLTRGFYGI